MFMQSPCLWCVLTLTVLIQRGEMSASVRGLCDNLFLSKICSYRAFVMVSLRSFLRFFVSLTEPTGAGAGSPEPLLLYVTTALTLTASYTLWCHLQKMFDHIHFLPLTTLHSSLLVINPGEKKKSASVQPSIKLTSHLNMLTSPIFNTTFVQYALTHLQPDCANTLYSHSCSRSKLQW